MLFCKNTRFGNNINHTLLFKNILFVFIDFGLSARTFCNEANTIGGPNYISDLFTEEELSASSSNDNDYEHLNFENENYSFLDNIL